MSEQENNTDSNNPEQGDDEMINHSDEGSETPEDSREAGEGSDLQSQLEAANKKAGENWDRFLRANAELENVRKRAERDIANAHKYALEKFASELLDVKDSLEIGLQTAKQHAGDENNAEISSVTEGMALTAKKMGDVMAKFGIEEVDPQDEPFNPDLHEAMAAVEIKDKPANTVIGVMQKGYTLNGRVLRPAMVQVSRSPSENQTESPADAGDADK